MGACMITRRSSSSGIKPEMITASVGKGGSVPVVNGSTYSCMVVVGNDYNYVSDPKVTFSGGNVTGLTTKTGRFDSGPSCTGWMYTFTFKATSSSLVVNWGSTHVLIAFVAVSRIS